MKYENIATYYLNKGYTEDHLMDACDNAIVCLVDCGHGQTYKTVHEYSHTEEGNELFIKYFIASIEEYEI